MIKYILLCLLLATPVYAEDAPGAFPNNTPVFSKSFAFDQPLDRTTPFVGLKPGSLAEAQNMMRPAPGIPVGWTMRKGMTKHNTTTLGANAINSLNKYVNKDFGTRCFLAQYNSTAIHLATNGPPTAGTTFGSSVYTATGATKPVFSDHINDDWVGAVTGAAPFAWAGGTAYPDGFYVDHDIVGGENAYNDGYKLVRNDVTTSYISFLQDTSDKNEAYIGFRRPIDGFHLYFGTTKNAVTSTMNVYYWLDDGSSPTWTAISAGFSDGTSSGGVSLAQDGAVVWTDAKTNEQPRLLDGTRDHLFWYKITMTASTTELMPNQVDRDFSGASAWANVDINAYDESTDLTITASAADQYCTLPVLSAPTTIGKKYTLTYDLANIVETWTVKSFDGTQTIGTISANATQGSLSWTATTTGGYRIVSVATTSSGDFDNFTLKSTNVLTPGVRVYKCTVADDVESITNLWSGYLVLTVGALMDAGAGYVDYSGEVTDGTDATYISMDSFATTSELYVAFVNKAIGINISMVATSPNDQASTPTVKYWDSSANAWTTVGTVTDGTSDGTISLAQSGMMSWTGSSITEDKRVLGGITVPFYWYQITWSANLGTDTQIWEVSQAEKPEAFVEYDGVIEYNDRAIWWPGKSYKSGLDFSQSGYPHIMNGPDSGETGPLFGPGEVNVLARLSSYALVSTKNPYRLYLLEGKVPSSFDSLLLSSNIGVVAPKSLVVIEDKVPIFNTERSVHSGIFLASDGVYMTDGQTLIKVSQPVGDYFNENSPYIEPTTMDDSYAWINYKTKTAHFAVPVNTSGTGTQTTLNKELVYSYVTNEWYDTYVRASPASCGLSLVGSDNDRMTYTGDYAGFVHRVNTGKADNGVKITHYIQTTPVTPLMGLIQDSLNYSSTLRAVKIKAKADTTASSICTILMYPDGKTTGVSAGTVSLLNSGYAYVGGKKQVSQTGDEFAFRFTADLLNSTLEIYGLTLDFMAQRPE